MTAPALTFTADELVELLRSQHGVTERPPGSNRVLYAADQGINGSAWCAALPAWGVDKLADRPGTWRAFWHALGCAWPYFTPSLVEAGKRAGMSVRRDQVRAGDLLFWDFPDSLHRVQHVDMAVGAFRGSSVVTIGGNTSSDERGSQSNGGGVFERVRSSSSLVAAIRLPYAAAATSPAPVHHHAPAHPAGRTATEAIVQQLPQLARGARGQHVRNAQSLLAAHGAGAGKVDGIAGPRFEAAVRTFQRAHRLDVDGVIGVGETWPALLDVK